MFDPGSAIWYVRASSTSGRELSEGSAVAVRLNRIGDPHSARTYLLTCGHVVRGTSADGQPGFGPVLKNIRVWAPKTGFSDAGSAEAKVHSHIKSPAQGDVPLAERANVAEDWLVLEIGDPQSAAAAPAVTQWAGTEEQGPFRIYGYPGGSLSFPREIVVPTLAPEAFPQRDVHQGVLRLTGSGTRPGISGGGVFTEQHLFAGIHRARADDALQLHAVWARHILNRLMEVGFEVTVAPASSKASIPQSGVSNGRWSVDAIPIDWSRPEPKALEKILIDNVQRDAAIRLAQDSGVPLGSIDESAPRRKLWRDLLTAASTSKRLRIFLKGIADDPEFAGIAASIESFL